MAAADYDFHGRTALITGGAGGIGAAVARTLQAGGAQVATFDSRAADLDGVLAIKGDVRRSEASTRPSLASRRSSARLISPSVRPA